jgi:long-chain fatty acid transport protein
MSLSDGRVHRLPRRRALSLSLLAPVVIALGASADASAAGLYFGDRGVRPLGRAGAFVAGADDLGAVPYNPAGIFDAGAQILVDGSWVHFESEYTRQSLLRQVDPNTGAEVGQYVQTYPKVHGTTPFLPIPTLAASFKPHPQWVVGFSVFAPNATLTSYPDKVDDKPAPQRYSLITLEGSALAFIAATAAFAPTREWRLGATLGVVAGQFNTTVNFSACVPERFLCAPEDPDWDGLAELREGPIVAPFGELGAIWIPNPSWRVGLSMTLPVPVRSSGSLHARLPAAPLFENAKQEGDSVSVAFNLPLILRAGVETRALPGLRVEAGVAYEGWSIHQSIDVTPNSLALTGAAGFPQKYYVPPVSISRGFRDSVSARLGGEFSFKTGPLGWTPRAGVSFETSAIPTNYLSVLTYDANKVTTALGASVQIGKVRVDATYAHLFPADVTVDPKDAKIAQVSPVAANPPKHPNIINGGVYSARADIIGLGFAYSFDPAQAGEAQPAPSGENGAEK